MPAENVVLHKLEEVNKSVKVEPFSPFQYVSFSMMPCRKPKKRFSEIDACFFFLFHYWGRKSEERFIWNSVLPINISLVF